MKEPKQANLIEIASNQSGYFTATQAEEAGYTRPNYPYYVRKGFWIKEGRGLYRLSGVPQERFSQYWEVMMSFRNHKDKPLGYFSKETVFSLYELSDYNPAKIYMTFPRYFKTTQKIPKVLKIEKEHLQKKELDTFQGLQIISLKQTLIDMADDESKDEDSFELAVKEAYKKGLIDKSFVRKNSSLARYLL